MSQQKLCTVSELKRKIVQFALVVAVQVALVLCLDLFANGLVGLGPLRLPIGVAGYRYGGRVCLLTVFMPGMIVWNLNEAVDEAKKQEPLDWEALILQLSEICRPVPFIPFRWQWSMPCWCCWTSGWFVGFGRCCRCRRLRQSRSRGGRSSGAGSRPMISAPSKGVPGTSSFWGQSSLL